jgi:hypothetical protein
MRRTPQSLVQKAGTAGLGQTTCDWTKSDLDEQIIGQILKGAMVSYFGAIGHLDLYQEI